MRGEYVRETFDANVLVTHGRIMERGPEMTRHRAAKGTRRAVNRCGAPVSHARWAGVHGGSRQKLFHQILNVTNRLVPPQIGFRYGVSDVQHCRSADKSQSTQQNVSLLIRNFDLKDGVHAWQVRLAGLTRYVSVDYSTEHASRSQGIVALTKSDSRRGGKSDRHAAAGQVPSEESTTSRLGMPCATVGMKVNGKFDLPEHRNEAAARDRNRKPVLILGAGINGCALARELALNGIPVWIVDRNDVACGATSKSSRLIHGGLRYLEYGEFQLVRESVIERNRLLRIAPQFVEPLRLFIPARRRFAGMIVAILRFGSGLGIPVLSRLAAEHTRATERGLWLIRAGLWCYRLFSGDRRSGNTSTVRLPAEGTPRINPGRYRWACSYHDAQIRYPERFALSLLHDAQRLAKQHETELRVLTHATALRSGRSVSIRDAAGRAHTLEPALIVNATGAWGDLTLDTLRIESPRLFGGTKGSHFITHNAHLRDALAGAGVYAEADDGRLVFILPFGEFVLVGTTDEWFEGPPQTAVASSRELDYLIAMVNDVLDGANLTREDVTMHYSGVRPLPYRPGGSTEAVSRDHSIVRQDNAPIPTVTLIGGKLTTCRAFAELAAHQILSGLNRDRRARSDELPVFGSAGWPGNVDNAITQAAARLGQPVPRVRAVWKLIGTATESVLAGCSCPNEPLLEGTDIPIGFVRWTIANEWVESLDDLLERRLMLLYRSELTEVTLRGLSQCLVEAGRLADDRVDAAVSSAVTRLNRFHGLRVLAAG